MRAYSEYESQLSFIKCDSKHKNAKRDRWQLTRSFHSMALAWQDKSLPRLVYRLKPIPPHHPDRWKELGNLPSSRKIPGHSQKNYRRKFTSTWKERTHKEH
ncbi:hypothetical protein J4Q44_G00098400 [Coregonus suidteri]|uniref:Uncharacterized protein n=1 Tax=Coregonus suidteri TaxID=861788 RepID=A0AAN8R2L1_9TELE